jgi:CRP/FNR family cyclic AMP-dependent transcriptional regulator
MAANPQPNNGPEDYVTALPLLARLPQPDRLALAHRARLRSFKAGTTIFGEGEPGDSLHVVVDGRVRIVAGGPNGEEATVAVVGPGDCFGEFSLLDGLPRSASAVAPVATKTFMVTRDDFVDWVTERPTAALAIMETLSLRLRKMDEALVDLVSLDLPHRLAKQLLGLAKIHDLETVLNNGTLRLTVTQGELASMLGVSRESVNKTLNTFATQKILQTARGAITITDMAALRTFE